MMNQPLMSLMVALMILVGPAMTWADHPLEQQIAELVRVLEGKRVGFLTNPTSVDSRYRLIADRLNEHPDVQLVALFAPEHGIRGDQQAGRPEEDFVDPITNIPVFSLYGPRRAPLPEQLENVDVFLFDIQDVGARFYTYVWSMTLAMEAAAANGVSFVVFDRPNPIGLTRVEGPPITFDAGLVGRKWESAPFGTPIRHGMTVGEIATLVNEEWMDPKVDLTVVRVPGLTRDARFEQTGYPWISPSPNMPTIDTAIVYPGLCVFEGTNLSEGRGTTRPFEVFGAPWINGNTLADHLNAKGLPGVLFRPTYFRPSFSKHSGELVGGVQVHVTDEEAFEPVRTGLHALRAVKELYPEETEFRAGVRRLMGVDELQTRIMEEEVEAIIAGWQDDLAAFMELRAKHLLY